AGMAVAYPAGTVEIREVKVLWSSGNNRTILVRGWGFASPLAEVLPRGGGAPVAATVTARACDADVWQRLYVTVSLAAGSYTMRVTRQDAAYRGAQGSRNFDV